MRSSRSCGPRRSRLPRRCVQPMSGLSGVWTPSGLLSERFFGALPARRSTSSGLVPPTRTTSSDAAMTGAPVNGSKRCGGILGRNAASEAPIVRCNNCVSDVRHARGHEVLPRAHRLAPHRRPMLGQSIRPRFQPHAADSGSGCRVAVPPASGGLLRRFAHRPQAAGRRRAGAALEKLQELTENALGHVDDEDHQQEPVDRAVEAMHVVADRDP